VEIGRDIDCQKNNFLATIFVCVCVCKAVPSIGAGGALAPPLLARTILIVILIIATFRSSTVSIKAYHCLKSIFLLVPTVT
jgi:hypothetical protein